MPEIPQFNLGREVQITPDRAQESPEALSAPGRAAAAGALQEGAATERLGRAVEGIGGDLGRLAEFHAINYYNDNLADVVNGSHERLEAAKEEAARTGNYTGLAQAQLDAFDKDVQARVEGAPGTVGSRLAHRFAVQRAAIQTRAAAFEHGGEVSNAKASLADDFDNSAKTVYRDPTLMDAQIARIEGRLSGTEYQGLFSPADRQKLSQTIRNGLATASVQARAQNDPAGLAADWEAKRYDPYLDAASLEKLAPLVQTAQGKAIGRSTFRDQGGAAVTGPQPNASDEEADRALAPVALRENRAGNPTLGYGGVDLSVAPLDATGFPIWAGRMGPQGISHAAGLFQIQPGTWRPIAEKLGISDFSPESQRAVARELYRQEGLAPWAASAGGAAANLDAGIAAIQGQNLPPRAEDAAIAEYTRQHHQWQQATAQDRARLVNDTTNGIAMLATGRDAVIDEAGLRRLLPAEKADELLRAAGEARDTGHAVNQVQWASPEELVALQARTMATLNDPTDFARKQRQAKAIGAAIDQRQKLLNDDPAGYVAGAPAVAAARSQIDPQNPAAGTQAAIAASLAEQEHLGVPPEKQSALTKAAAGALVKRIVGTDPAKADMGAALDQTAQIYGPHWPRAFGDLVRAGLPPEAQNLAAMDRPEQAAARTDFQRMLSLVAEKHGVEQLKAAAPREAVQTIGQGIDSQMADFRATVRDPRLYDAVKNGVEHLAYYYAFQGRSGDAALRDAYDGMIGRKYDFSGSWRAPKGMSGTVEAAGDQLLQGLTQPAQPAFDTTQAPGMVKPGNLDPWRRPVLYNPDGSYSTTSSISIGTDAGEVVIPTVINGKRLSNDDAIAHYRATGENLGTFANQATAEAYSVNLHNAQASMYDAQGNPKSALSRIQDPGPGSDGSGADLTPDQRRAAELSAIRRGSWEVNKSDTGLVRMALRRDGARVPAIVDGKPLEFKFEDAARLAQGVVPPEGAVPTMGGAFQ